MAKANPLSKALKAKTKPVDTASNGSGVTQNYREGRVMIGGHFGLDVQTEIKIIAARERTTVQKLVGEALNLLIVKKGGKPFAELEA